MRKEDESAVAPVLSRIKMETNVPMYRQEEGKEVQKDTGCSDEPAAILMFQTNEVLLSTPSSSRGDGSCSPPGRTLTRW